MYSMCMVVLFSLLFCRAMCLAAFVWVAISCGYRADDEEERERERDERDAQWIFPRVCLPTQPGRQGQTRVCTQCLLTNVYTNLNVKSVSVCVISSAIAAEEGEGDDCIMLRRRGNDAVDSQTTKLSHKTLFVPLQLFFALSLCVFFFFVVSSRVESKEETPQKWRRMARLDSTWLRLCKELYFSQPRQLWLGPISCISSSRFFLPLTVVVLAPSLQQQQQQQQQQQHSTVSLLS